MISLTPPYSRINRVVFVFGIVCLATILAGTLFVTARSDDGELSATQADASSLDRSTKARIAERFGLLPLSFEINKGQTDNSVKFLSHGPGYDLFLTANEAILNLRKPQAPDAKVREGSVLRLKLIGANTAPRVEGQDELPGKINYFTGNNPEKWRRNIPTYRKVMYRDVYPGIDVVYYGNQRELEYDFVVAPGANPKVIKFSVEGAERIRLDRKGNLLLGLKHGEVRLNKPFIYQLTDEGNRREVKGSYVIKRNQISFNVRGIDSSKPLVIDPVLSYATFLGGNGNDDAMGIAVDAQGSAYVIGTTNSFPFPTTPGALTDNHFDGAYISKLDPTGSTLVYSTFLSSSGGTRGTSIAVDSSGNAHITGSTSTNDFPVVNGLKTSANFFKSTDSASTWSNNNTGLAGDIKCLAVAPSAPNTIYAGTQNGPFRSSDAGSTWTKTPTTGLPSFVSSASLAVDPTNASVVYIGLESDGLFKSTDGGNNWGAVNVPLNNSAVFTILFDPATPSTIYVGSSKGVFKSTDSGSSWTALNNFGAAGILHIRALAIDPTTPATIYAGTTSSGVFKSTNGGGNWTAMNNGILGGDFSSAVNAIVIDPSNPSTIYAAHDFSGGPGGFSKSTNGAASWTQINNGVPPNDAIKAMVGDRTNTDTLYAATLSSGIIKTTNGGATWTLANTGLWRPEIRALVAHPSDSTILYAGATASNFNDAFVSKLNATGSDLLFSTFLGGSFSDLGLGIAVDSSGNIAVVGSTNSTNFPTVNAFQSTPGPNVNCTGSRTAFVTKINPSAPSYVFSTYLGGSRCDTATSVATDSAANVYVTGSTFSADFPIANAFQATIGDTFSREDAFVTKFNSSGALSYSTYLGGNNADTGFGIAVDSSGNAYVTGSTVSTNFPTANPIKATSEGGDAFVTKLNSQGSALVYSTYLGGSGSDTARGIAVDLTGNAYITGFTSSIDFPLVAGAIQTNSALFKSVDAGTNWSNDNYGLKSTVTDLVVHPTQTATLYAATRRGLFRSTDAGKNWSPINNGLNGDIFDLVIDPLTPSTLYGITGEFVSGGGLYKSTDGGNSWNLRTNGMIHNGVPNTDLLSLAIDPVTPTTLYAGVSGVMYKTTDGADNWAPSGNPPPIFPSSIAVDPHTHTRIFATESLSAGGVFRSVDSGASWQSVSVNQTGAHGSFVGVSPHTPGLVYAATTSGLFKSVDGGDSWSSVRPQSRFAKIVFDPVSSSTLYLISSFEGLLKSTDNGQTWKDMNNGFPEPAVTAFAINPLRTSTLYLAGSSHNQDAFVTKINPAGSALLYSTFVGGTRAPAGSSGTDVGAFAIALDSAGNAYITGSSRSTSFPASPNGFQPFNRGFSDAFIAKLSMSHIISGHVLDGVGVPVSGAEVALSDGASITAIITDSDGSYEFSHLPEGGSFTVSASKPHFTIAPPSQSFNNLTSNQTLNFTATATNAPFFNISGQITDNGAGLAGVSVALSGSQLGLRTTDSNGNYSFEVAGGGSYTVTPSTLGFAFDPPSRTFNDLSASQAANFTANRQSFVVTTANDHGTGSLREAITNANATPGADTITFNIPGPGVKVINVVAPLPEITESVIIDATTQPAYAGAPLVELDGNNTNFENGLVITAGGTTVRGLAIGRFDRAGIWLRSCDNNVIQGNYLGVDATGTQPRPNNTGILLFDSSNNLIGGTTAAARNVISGNVVHGAEIGGNNNIVQGNFIGTNAAGTAALANGASGVEIPFSARTNNLIGGTAPGSGNLISGNQRGIRIESEGNTIQGNLIGTDLTGTKKVGNSTGIEANIPNTLIGGLTTGARNIISGNGTGVSFSGSGSRLQGNFIGTDITGTLALGNNDGVVSGTSALIGGTVPEARNVIAGNIGFGNIVLSFNPSGPGVIVQGNYIGIDVTGTRSLSESTSAGILISSSNNLIGGVVPGAENVISGNVNGIRVGSVFGFPQGNVIQGNLIGLNALGAGALPNTESGINCGTFNNTIGGTQSGAANKIAFNGEAGIRAATGTRNSFRGNSIFSNGGLGIDLGTEGVTDNDPDDSDAGANNLQNFPVLTSVTSIGNSTTILGSLKSTANATFHIDFYSSAALDPSGNGEGALFFNTTSITTDGNGDATINVTFPAPLATGRVMTATATDQDGNTSEFSSGDVTSAAGNLQFSVSSIEIIEDLGVLTLTVLRKGGSTGSLSVDYATIDGTATAGQDYTATSGTLTFNGGETSQTIQIPILNDDVTESFETFTVVLRNGANLEAVGAPHTLVVTVLDNSTVPSILRVVPAVIEGNTGSTTEALFTFSLSAATGRLVSANYTTANVSAFGSASCSNTGTDYETVSGTITFQPGNTLVTIPVKVCGDASAEATETFRINLSSLSNAVVGFNQAAGTIIDDDVLELLLEESGPTVGHAAALDALLFLRDPFRVSMPEWFPTTASDRNTRVMFFVRGLQLNPGESPAAVFVQLTASNNQLFAVPAEDVRSVPNVDFAQLIIRLPDALPADTYTVTVRAHSRTSNAGMIRIAP
ncbi:MAG TPA: SBBP repeat-containing protein [Pyrinomonadaceae bacterium]